MTHAAAAASVLARQFTAVFLLLHENKLSICWKCKLFFYFHINLPPSPWVIEEPGFLWRWFSVWRRRGGRSESTVEGWIIITPSLVSFIHICLHHALPDQPVLFIEPPGHYSCLHCTPDVHGVSCRLEPEDAPPLHLPSLPFLGRTA